MGKSIKDRLRQNAAEGKGQPTRSVPIFLGADLDLVERYQAVTDLLSQEEAGSGRRKAPRLGDVSDHSALEAELEELRAKLADAQVVFRLRGIDDGRWDRLVAQHPPRKVDDQIDPRDRSTGWNSATFPIALLRATVIDPDLDDEDWRLLLGTEDIDGQLSSGQLEQLVLAAIGISRGAIDIPFWSVASKATPNS